MARMTERVAAFGITLLLAGLLAGVLTGAAWATQPPKIVQQPTNVTVEEGQSASFEAVANGASPLTVQWEVSTDGGAEWTSVPGGTADKLTIASTKTSESGDEYRAVFTNPGGQKISQPARLTVQHVPVITKQPSATAAEEGQNAIFEADASGFPEPSVQWEVSTDGGVEWAPIPGKTNYQLTVISVKTSETGYEYRAVFTNVAGKVTSEAARLTVHNIPRVTKQPVGAKVQEGQTASFEADASGFPTPTIQWELSTDGGATWSPIEGATANRLTIANATVSESGNKYRAVFSNEAGRATSVAVTLTVTLAPAITEQPALVTVEAGGVAVFDASASGFPAPTVQWEISTDEGASWSAISGATSDQLTLEDVQASQNGDEYRAVFTNTAGSTATEAATLTVAKHHYRAVDWGNDAFGQLGDASLLQSDVPVTASGVNFVTAVAAGENHSLALLEDGTVVAWGANSSGQLGDGEESGAKSDVPVPVEGLSHVKAIAAGAEFSLALLDNGTVMAWGANEAGELGDGSFGESDVPVPVRGLTNVAAIAAGGEHALALLSGGKVMAWGEDERGELGDGTTNDSDVPVFVKALTGITAVAAGNEFSLALMSDGEVMAWGADEDGQLANSGVEEVGEGEERFSIQPVPVEGVSGVSAIAAGARHALALLTSGTVMAWGEDAAGELGDGVITHSQETPSAVSGLSGVTQIAAGGKHSLALLANGTVMTWGENHSGELGAGTAGEPSDVPVAVTDLGEVKGIAAGGYHDIAFSEPIPTVTGVSPALGAPAGGTSVTITGSSFEGATSVRFGASAAASFKVNSATSITAVAPAGTVGTVNVTVTTPAGTSPTVAADQFTYVAPPTVSGLSASSGSGAGGTPVTIVGSNFDGATVVDFGKYATTHFTVTSPSSITVTSPAGSGAVDVTVTTPGGTSATSKHDRFTYTLAVEAIAPNTGPAAGGTSVTITGVGFTPGQGATTFEFGSKKKKATDVECASTSSCTARTPVHSAGTAEVTALVGKLKSPANPPGDRFTYE